MKIWYTWEEFNTRLEFYIFLYINTELFHWYSRKNEVPWQLSTQNSLCWAYKHPSFPAMVYKPQFTHPLRNIYCFRGAAEKYITLILCTSTHCTNLWKTITHLFAFNRLYVLQYVSVVQLRGLNLPFHLVMKKCVWQTM